MKRHLIAAALAVAVASCASAPTTPYHTPSVSIEGGHAEDAKVTIIQSCIDGGGVVEQNTGTQLVCSIPMDDSFSAMMFRALMTPRYSTRPNLKARYNITETATRLHIAVDTFMEYETAFGQMNRTPIRNTEVAAKAQGMLDRIKASIEGGRPAIITGAPAPAPEPQAGPMERDPAKRCDACARLTVP